MKRYWGIGGTSRLNEFDPYSHDHRGAQDGRSASEYADISALTISLTASLLRAGGTAQCAAAIDFGNTNLPAGIDVPRAMNAGVLPQRLSTLAAKSD